MKRDLATQALNMTIAFRAPPKGCIHHTDHGSQHCSHDYRCNLRQNSLKVTMSGKGNCYEFKSARASGLKDHSKAQNAAVETLFSIGVESPVAFERKVRLNEQRGRHQAVTSPLLKINFKNFLPRVGKKK
jgi:putative transposase